MCGFYKLHTLTISNSMVKQRIKQPISKLYTAYNYLTCSCFHIIGDTDSLPIDSQLVGAGDG